MNKESTNLNKPLKVAVGVITNQQGQVLISQRSADAHQGGLWEFPGGKVDANETVIQGLRRELIEELGIVVESARSLIDIHHQYDEVLVCLEVLLVDCYQGEPRGMEGQPIKWVSISDLDQYAFPAANTRIIDVLNLPRYYPIVDDSIGSEYEMLNHLNALISQGYLMIQLRAKSLTAERFWCVAQQAIERCKENKVCLFVNTSLAMALELKAEAVHLNSRELNSLSRLTLDGVDMSFAVSCHSMDELEQSKKKGALFSVLSPVKKTASHPNAKPLGWASFNALAEPLAMPVYALGGLAVGDIKVAMSKGACGVSGISGFYTSNI